MNTKNCARGFTGLRIAWCATWFDMNVWDSICWMYQPLEIFWIVENIKRLKLDVKIWGTQFTTRGQFLRHREMNRGIFQGYILSFLPYILGISRQIIPIRKIKVFYDLTRRDKKVNNILSIPS